MQVVKHILFKMKVKNCVKVVGSRYVSCNYDSLSCLSRVWQFAVKKKNYGLISD